MLLAIQITCVCVILILYRVSPARLVEWYSRAIRCFLINTPYADKQKLFPGATILENNYKKIREELADLMRSEDFESGSGVNQEMKQEEKLNESNRSSLQLQVFDEWVHSKVSQMPYIDALLCELPQVTHAVVRVFRSGEHIPLRVRLFKGVLSYHLPLLSQTDGQNFIICGNIKRNYKEGVGVLLDETFQHEFWNRSDAPQVFLSLDITRDNALPRLVRPFNQILIKLIRHSKRMRDAMRIAEMKIANRSSRLQELQKIKQS